ncbi:MAG TPA: sigma-70 family RNA polymerase sigma factor [Candidatus Cloacimonetes bacterium]|nr:sigma-70 family RNA polymerase sigma factor [Candidatus Cloacimonadota bacterium]
MHPLKKALESLTDEQQRTLVLYNICDRNYQQMEEIAEVSAVAIRQRISRINNKLKAITYLNLGMIGTKKIVTPELNNVLYKFLTRFKKNLEESTLHKMYKYFSMADLKDYHGTIKIKETENYEIKLKDCEYQIIVLYQNDDDIREAFDFKFKIENNHLKITAPPKKKTIAATLKNDSEQADKLKELLHLYPPDRTGKSTIPKELLDALIKKNTLST